MITETWTFPQFDVAPSEDGLTNVVKTIHWRLDVIDGDYSAGAYGTVALDAPNPAAFVPFDQITEAWAIVVVSDKIELTEVRAALEGEIAKKKNPPVVPMQPPFAA